MSTGHENVIWQSPDGTWNRGFFLAEPSWDDPEEYEYDMTQFQWVSCGHATEQDAHASWRGANPGGSTIYTLPEEGSEYEAQTREAIDEFDDLAGALWDEGSWGCEGVRKRRVPRLLARYIGEAMRRSAGHKLDGYANLPEDVSKEIQQLRERLPELTDTERTAVVNELLDAKLHIARKLDDATGRHKYPISEHRQRLASPEAREFATQLRDELGSLAAAAIQAAPATPKPTTSPTRGKTSPKSTAGSFAPKSQSDPDITLG